MARVLNPRGSDRKSVILTAQCRTQTGMRDTGRISDISAQGCCVSTNYLFFNVGSRVLIKPEGMEGLSGVVRWIDRERAGIEFDAPIYEPVLDHLTKLHGTGAHIALQAC